MSTELEDVKREVATANREALGSHQEKPATCPAHHAVPDQADRAEWQLERLKAQSTIETEDAGSGAQLRRNSGKRLVPSEG